jgi:hypothetical protein
MAGLMDSLGETLTTQTLGQIGKRIGVDEATMQKGMDAATPAVLGSLSKAASTPAGLDEIMSQMSSMQGSAKDGDVMSSVLGSMVGGGGGLGGLLGGLLGGGSPMSAGAIGGNSMLGALLGPALGAISGTLSKKLGFDVGPILSVAAPLIIGMLTKQASANGLDKQGVASLLQTESKAYFDKGGENASLVQSALDAGDKVTNMVKGMGDNYGKLQLAPLAVAKLVVESSRSGPIGTLEELTAGAGAVGAAVKAADPTSLITAVFSTDPLESNLESVAKMDKSAALGLIREAVAGLSGDNKTAVAAMLLDVAQKTAEASKEGGFLGIGGVRVSDQEKAAIEEIRTALA